MMYLEVAQKNYGKAGEYSREVFDHAQQIASSTEDPALRNLLSFPLSHVEINFDNSTKRLQLQIAR